MMAADAPGFAWMYSTALRLAFSTPRINSPFVVAASPVVTPTTLHSSGSAAAAIAMTLYLPGRDDHSGSSIGATSIPPSSRYVSPGSSPPVRLRVTSDGGMAAPLSHRRSSPSLVEPELVYPSRRPLRSCTELTGDEGSATHKKSTTL